jgi:flagellar basal-body rod protein FlgC
MDYSQVFEISASGMQAQKTRLEVAAHNLANINTVTKSDGTPYQPMRVVTTAKSSASFESAMAQQGGGSGVVTRVVPDTSTTPRVAHEPGHPNADANGMVKYPGINHLDQMMTINQALRAYEANVAALQAAKSMAAKALEIGGGQ